MNDATSQIEKVRAGRQSAVDATEAAIHAIETRDDALNAVILRDFDRARQAARQVDQRLRAGQDLPLAGLAMTIKESFDVAGLPTCWGIETLKDHIAEQDSTVVQRLKAAGAVILGKTNVSEALAGWNAVNPVYGRTNNPCDTALTPGGSSSGAAAAVASGMVALDIGSDLGGSIRFPAHFCGIWGHNPTAGLIPPRGHVLGGRRARQDMSTPGPMARSARDLSLTLGVLAGPDDEDGVALRLTLPAPRHRAIGDFRVLVLPEHPAVPTEPALCAAVEDCARLLSDQGATVQSATGRIPDLDHTLTTYMALLAGALGLGHTPPQRAAFLAEAAALAPDDRSIRAQRIRARVLSHTEWLEANEARLRLRLQWVALMRDYDAVICPPCAVAALSHADAAAGRITINGTEVDAGDPIAWASVATGPGLPATVLPFTTDGQNRPVGVQIIGPYMEDLTPITLAGLIGREIGADTA